MTNSLLSLADNLAGRIENSKCKDCKPYLKYVEFKDKLLILNCLNCSKIHKKYVKENLTKRLANTYKFCDEDINKCCLMLIKRSLFLRVHRRKFESLSVQGKKLLT